MSFLLQVDLFTLATEEELAKAGALKVLGSTFRPVDIERSDIFTVESHQQ